MVARIRHRRFLTTAAGWVSTLQYGELTVNPLRREIMIGDADGTARSLLAIRIYDARSQYAGGDFVTQGGVIYRAHAAITIPEAFNVANWDQVGWQGGTLDLRYALIGHLHAGVYSPVAHNHDGSYAALAHNHDGSYAAIGHNHDGSYATIGHNHDGSYVRLIGSTSSGTQTFAGAPSIVTTGAVSIGAGGAPISKLHVKENGTVAATIEAVGAFAQARLHLVNDVGSWLWYAQETTRGINLFDYSIGRAILRGKDGITVGVPAGDDKGYGTLNAVELWENNVRVASQAYVNAAVAGSVGPALQWTKAGEHDTGTAVAALTVAIPANARNLFIMARALPAANSIVNLRLLAADGTTVLALLSTIDIVESNAGAGGLRIAAWANDCQAGTNKTLIWNVVDHVSIFAAGGNRGNGTNAVVYVQILSSGQNTAGNLQVHYTT